MLNCKRACIERALIGLVGIRYIDIRNRGISTAKSCEAIR
jgi:hypothetical protein